MKMTAEEVGEYDYSLPLAEFIKKYTETVQPKSKELNKQILAVSQFTLYGDCTNGNRPSFTDAMSFEKANEYYNEYCNQLRANNIDVEMGVFGADMKIDFINDGPVTIIIDSRDR